MYIDTANIGCHQDHVNSENKTFYVNDSKLDVIKIHMFNGDNKENFLQYN